MKPGYQVGFFEEKLLRRGLIMGLKGEAAKGRKFYKVPLKKRVPAFTARTLLDSLCVFGCLAPWW